MTKKINTPQKVSVDDCLQAVMQTGLNETEAKNVVDDLLRKKEILKKEFQAKGTALNMDKELAQAWIKGMDEQRINSALQRKQAAINLLAKKNLDNYIQETMQAGYSFLDAMEGLMVGSTKRFFGARKSVAATRQGIQRTWQGGMLNELDELGKKHGVNLAKLFRNDTAFHDAVVSEMFTPNSTGDALCRDVADMFSRYLEEIRLRENAAGANIGRIDNYVPQTHDPFKMGKKSDSDASPQNDWVNFIYSRLDLERTFPDLHGDEAEIKKILAESYATIITRGDSDLSAYHMKKDSAEGAGSDRGSNLVNRLGRHRSFHFKDATSFLEYNKQYGRGNIIDGMQRRIENSARTVALIETFGINPQRMLERLVTERRAALSIDDAMSPELKIKELAALDTAHSAGTIRGGKLTHWLAELTGETQWASNLGLARAMSIARSLQAVAKLGAATLSSCADPFIKASAMRVAGMSWGEAFVRSITQYFNFYSGDKKKLARELGFMTEGILGDMRLRWDINESLPGKMSDIQNRFFKYSGLNWITESGKAGYATWFSHHLGEVSSKSFDKLDEPRKALLEYHGINAEKWEVMRKMVEEGSDGRTYFVPSLAENLSNLELEKLLPASLQEKSQPTNKNTKQFAQWLDVKNAELNRLRQEIRTEAATMVSDETLFAVLEPDEKTRAMMFRGTRPGTTEGEILRSIWQFKSFPMAYAQRVLGGRRWIRGDKQVGLGYGWTNPKTYKDAFLKDVPGVVGFAVSAYLFGYMAMTLKDLSKGKKPRDPTAKETVFAALLQSGGAGIVGDFLFGKVDRFGNGFADTMIGPLGGVVGDAMSIAGEVMRGDFASAGEDGLRLAIGNTPYVNLWYTKAALDWLIIYHLREWMSPGTLEREAKRIKKDFGQEFIINPHTKIKKGGGWR